jgi:hypothetical protein
MPPRMSRRGAVVTAAAIATLGLATAAPAAIIALPQVNDDPANGIDPNQDAGVSDVADGSLAAGGQRVPWATFEQKSGSSQQIFVRSFKDGVFTTRGNPASLNIDRSKEAEAPSIDFAGAGRTVPWVSWYEPNDNLPGGETNIFASRFDAAADKWVPEGQDRAPDHKVPSLNINTNREAENPAVAGGAAVAGNDPVPWVAWQEKDGAATNDASKDQIFVSRAIKGATTPVDCSANEPGGGTSVSKFCWQQTGIKRLNSGQSAAYDPSLNIDPTRNGIEPDIAFTGPQDTVPWVVWYEKDGSGIGLAGNEQVFAAKAVKDATPGLGGFHWQAVGNGTTNQTNVLDTTGAHKLGNCSESPAAEAQCTLNLDPAKDAEDPRVAAGTLTPGATTVPWVAWAETTAAGHESIFVSRLVGDHFELANGGKPVSNPNVDAFKPDITFSRNTPYVTWQKQVGGERRTIAGHFTSLTSFVLDTSRRGLRPGVVPDLREPISSACTSDPFTADGTACPAGDATPVFLRTTATHPQRLQASLIVAGQWPRISGHPLKLRHGAVRVKASCPKAHKPRCVGTLKITARHRTLGHRHFSMRAGHSARVKVHINRRGQRLVHRVHRLKVKITAGTSHRKVLLRG